METLTIAFLVASAAVMFVIGVARIVNHRGSAWPDFVGGALILVSALILSLPASGQEAWTHDPSNGQIARAECYRVIENARLCVLDGFPEGCTQAQINAKVRPEGAEVPNLLNDNANSRARVAFSLGLANLPAADDARCEGVRKKVRWLGLSLARKQSWCTDVEGLKPEQLDPVTACTPKF